MATLNLIEIWCILDEFCKYFAPELKKHQISVPGKRHRNCSSRLSDSEVMTILMLFLQTCTLGKCTMGWFYGFKLHLVINNKGEVIQWQLTPVNVDDRAPLKDSRFTEKLFGKLFADRGYISQGLFQKLFVDDIHMVTKIKKNMKNSLMNLHDKILLRKRSVIKTVNDELKNVCQIEHTRHRSADNLATNLLAGLIAYNLLPKKPSMNIDIMDKSKLIA